MARAFWMRDVIQDDPALFDVIYEIQSLSYRKSRATRGQVWSSAVFAARAADYVLWGALPERRADDSYPTAAEAISLGCGFVFGRLLPKEGPPFLCLKLSGMAGNLGAIRSAGADVQALGLPVFAAADPRLAAVVRRYGFAVLPATLTRMLMPLLIDKFLQPPWQFEGLAPCGAIMVSHPELQDPATGQPIVHLKRIVVTRKSLRGLFALAAVARVSGPATVRFAAAVTGRGNKATA